MFEKQLKQIIEEANQTSCYFIGGTLCIDNPTNKIDYVMLQHDGNATAKTKDDWIIPFSMSDQERILYAEIYVSHKSENHHYYDEQKKILERGIEKTFYQKLKGPV